LRRLGVEAVEVRLPQHLEGLDGLIIPGGESTTIGKLMVQYGLIEPIRELAASGRPILGTCAGMIMMAREITGSDQPRLGLMDIQVDRNAFGRQVASFETALSLTGVPGEPFPAIFIRAPRIREVGDGVEVLGRLEDGTVVAARQDNLVVLAFHPELTDDPRLHAFFVQLAVPSTAPVA
ncbi:MAG TPA: pyridoxal 5'-phosphate synthase glutaminase subunit PdxT, partial [Dehalococcoidia bacterium]|nr:pyridoxal 5'-phosphate synthase glutaminase subunit PdxT [Dehalococcoidia bacterium]